MADANAPDADQRSLQFMTAEHFVLQTARSATVQEANQRALALSSSRQASSPFAAITSGRGTPPSKG